MNSDMASSKCIIISTSSEKMSDPKVSGVYRIPPYYYIHVLDQNTNVPRLEVGPKTFVKQDHEKVLVGPEKHIIIPPRHYCVIENPAMKDKKGQVMVDTHGQVRLLHSDLAIKFTQEPFPLYPGEVLKQAVTPLKVIEPNCALRLRAVLDFIDDTEKPIRAGDEWLFEGPGTYYPRKEVAVEEQIKATILKPTEAVRLRAKKEMIDRDGEPRETGEEWLNKTVGAYLPLATEEVVRVVQPIVLTDKKAVHLRALRTFKDNFGNKRLHGEEWLVYAHDTETYIPDVYEEVVGDVMVTALNSRQYCVILDAVGKNGKPQLGKKQLVKGEKTFFLQPGERLAKGIQDVYVLEEDEGLILKCTEAFKEDGKVLRSPGDRWMIRGPIDYIPAVESEVVLRRKAIPLDMNEGIYVRDVKTGKIRSVIGNTYLLTENEELWEKDLPEQVEQLLNLDSRYFEDTQPQQVNIPPRDKSKVVAYRVPHNAAVQIYDYKAKKARIVFGPELVMLGPDEQFTVFNISGGKPKVPNKIRAICLLLGPEFSSDIVTIESADHARLNLKLSYNWHFDIRNKDAKEVLSIFSVPDFIVAAKIRGAVAGVNFDDFHKNSARIIRASVFGLEKGTTKINNRFVFPQNNLVLTSIDIQSVEPVDQRTRDALQKSVQLAIEITTNSQEAHAKHIAEKAEQEARGHLERQKIHDEAEERRNLLLLTALSAAVEATGQAKAEAQSRAESAKIEGEAAVYCARLRAEASRIEAEVDLYRLTQARELELAYSKVTSELEVDRTQRLVEIEVDEFKKHVAAIGPKTIQAIATSGPDMQVKLLQSLGIKSTLITDGRSPINLFNTAKNLVGDGQQGTSVIPSSLLSTI
ncbi:unnamed protein product [Didymodactylos carnosus]|uniref:Major vault protein n=1 Tax=Didymodactylos carnosus TaxID=1234261 RepID=A0A814CLS7_9BILA|nr:unnamed protein product [Didymodactylos carnosus]CAF1054367.1 unnamed protein product [Didymodactylos carnosus]CAF3722465.1 unnamed protein product [Didymodactylos carnosus]CAF3820739.1 unnamed protein product [Didymodactylos carnosus]